MLRLADGPYTVMRFADNADKMLLLTGEIRRPALPYWQGSRGWMTALELDGERISALDFANTIMAEGFPHHFPLVRGTYRSQLRELAAHLGIQPIQARPYTEYLTL